MDDYKETQHLCKRLEARLKRDHVYSDIKITSVRKNQKNRDRYLPDHRTVCEDEGYDFLNRLNRSKYSSQRSNTLRSMIRQLKIM